jgi:23S rRNA (cytosine1962-C5)-methyltransferase
VPRATDDYALLDFGDGRRLERFGSLVVDRPAPAVAGLPRRDPAAWTAAAARYERLAAGRTGRWLTAGQVPSAWLVEIDGLVLELRLTPAGQVGIFPEQRPVAHWAVARAGDVAAERRRPAEILNLFAHTGLATLALAAAGARLVHVDSSRGAIAWARRNAGASGLADRPIRWLVDDAARFVAREERRGHRYDGVLLDPPTYGHGPRGGAWHLASGLEDLLAGIGRVLAEGPWFVACTAHATGLDPVDLASRVRGALARPAAVEAMALKLESVPGAVLPAGSAVLVRGDLGGGP